MYISCLCAWLLQYIFSHLSACQRVTPAVINASCGIVPHSVLLLTDVLTTSTPLHWIFDGLDAIFVTDFLTASILIHWQTFWQLGTDSLTVLPPFPWQTLWQSRYNRFLDRYFSNLNTDSLKDVLTTVSLTFLTALALLVSWQVFWLGDVKAR